MNDRRPGDPAVAVFCAVCGEQRAVGESHDYDECRRRAAVQMNPSHEHAWALTFSCSECGAVALPAHREPDESETRVTPPTSSEVSR